MRAFTPDWRGALRVFLPDLPIEPTQSAPGFGRKGRAQFEAARKRPTILKYTRQIARNQARLAAKGRTL